MKKLNLSQLLSLENKEAIMVYTIDKKGKYLITIQLQYTSNEYSQNIIEGEK
jgi:hypothetical protein